MKSHLITTGKATILAVDLPEGAKIISVDNEYGVCTYFEPKQRGGMFDLPPGEWEPLGLLNEISEEVAERLVDNECFGRSGGLKSGYRNYRSGKYDWFGTATESLNSLIASEVCLVNPLGEKPPKAICMIGGMELLVRGSMTYELNAQRLGRWREAEEKVFKNPIILLKKN